MIFYFTILFVSDDGEHANWESGTGEAMDFEAEFEAAAALGLQEDILNPSSPSRPPSGPG